MVLKLVKKGSKLEDGWLVRFQCDTCEYSIVQYTYDLKVQKNFDNMLLTTLLSRHRDHSGCICGMKPKPKPTPKRKKQTRKPSKKKAKLEEEFPPPPKLVRQNAVPLA